MGEKNIKYSIIICAYNIEDYIERAIKSVLNQKFDNYEIIVVDDNSEDNTMNNIVKYEKDGVKIYKTKSNTGTAAGARNIGIDKAKGKYIIHLDGDDTLYDDETLLKIDNVVGEDELDVIFFGYEDVGGTNSKRIYNEKNSTKKSRLICDISFSVSSRVWNKEFLLANDMRFIEGMYYEDEIYCMKANILAKKVKYGDIPIFKYYRNRKGSVMSTPSVKRCSDIYRMIAELMDLYNIASEEDKRYLLSFIKNETESLPIKVKTILKALKDKTDSPVLPKREYRYTEVLDEY